MAKFRQAKAELIRQLNQDDSGAAMKAATAISPLESISPLLACLPRGGLITWRAAEALGVQVASLAAQELEAARNVMRRLMWHLNEDSGNLGWGIPEAFGCITFESPRLAAEFGRILCSYVRDTGGADNYLEHGPLRAAAWWGVSRLGATDNPESELARSLLPVGLEDDFSRCRAVCCWAILLLVQDGMLTADPELVRRLQVLLNDPSQAEVYRDGREETAVAADCAREALRLITA